MTEKKGPLWFKIDWNPETGALHGEGNLSAMETVALLEMEKFAVIRQMAGGAGSPGGVETISRLPALQARRIDQVN